MNWQVRYAAGVAVLGLILVPGVVWAEGGTDVLNDVPSVVAVVDPATTPDFPAGSLMRADCDVVVRVEAEDGSAQEWTSCTLSDEPVMIPENQGLVPDAVVVDSGGECIWSSDYWFTVDESEVYADAFEAVVTPSGRVYSWASYPAEPLDCALDE